VAHNGEPLVDIARVQLTYEGGTLAVERLDMQVEQGEFVALVGPSGCGKSSLMKLVSGLVAPSSGQVRVAGRIVAGPLKIVGMAFQNPTLLPWRTTRDNLLLPLEIVQPYRSRFRSERRAYRADADALLASVGLAGFEDRFPWQLSGGMQQRASLCRALIHKPSLLLLDEPFGALDAFTREELWDILQDIWMERRFTTILVTHDLREAVYLADRVVVMSSRPGRVVAEHAVDLPRPRRLETTFDPHFVEVVRELREHIRIERDPIPAGTAA